MDQLFRSARHLLTFSDRSVRQRSNSKRRFLRSGPRCGGPISGARRLPFLHCWISLKDAVGVESFVEVVRGLGLMEPEIPVGDELVP
jgi:hypothetical protein